MDADTVISTSNIPRSCFASSLGALNYVKQQVDAIFATTDVNIKTRGRTMQIRALIDLCYEVSIICNQIFTH